MSMKSLLEKMMKFAGEPEQKAGDQVRGAEKAKKSSKDHPFKGRLVGDSVEPQANMLEELSQEAQDKSIEWSLAEAWAEFKEEAFKDTAERRPARKGSRPSRGHAPVPGYKEVDENAEELNVGDDVIITGPVEHQGETGVIDSFGQDNRFVVVNLYNHGKKSFHSSDVSYNDYADSDAEEAEMYDRDPEFRDWAAKQEVDEGWESGPEERAPRERDPDWEYDQRRQEKMDIEAEKAQAQRPQEKVYTLLGRGPNMEPNYRFPGEYSSQEAAIAARARLMADPNTPHPEHIGISSYTRYLDEGRDTPLRDLEDYSAKKKALQDIQMDPSTGQDPELSAEVVRRLAGLEQQRSELGMDESRAHKILARKLADIERKPSVPSADDEAARAEQSKEDYRKYVAKMKKKDPNFVPLYKIDEYGATATNSATNTMATPDQAKKIAQASQALKAATGSTAPAPNIVKAIDHASQGKPVGQQDMKALEPLMKDIATVASEPKLAGQFKSLVQQIDKEQKLQAK